MSKKRPSSFDRAEQENKIFELFSKYRNPADRQSATPSNIRPVSATAETTVTILIPNAEEYNSGYNIENIGSSKNRNKNKNKDNNKKNDKDIERANIGISHHYQFQGSLFDYYNATIPIDHLDYGHYAGGEAYIVEQECDGVGGTCEIGGSFSTSANASGTFYPSRTTNFISNQVLQPPLNFTTPVGIHTSNTHAPADALFHPEKNPLSYGSFLANNHFCLDSLEVPVLPYSNTNTNTNTIINSTQNKNKSLDPELLAYTNKQIFTESRSLLNSSHIQMESIGTQQSVPKDLSSVAAAKLSSNNPSASTLTGGRGASSSPASISPGTTTTAAIEKVKRRKHKNSKLGCPNCKKRRVKCSEDLPSCINCIKHKVKCGYLDYTEEQLKELRDAKQQNAVSSLQRSRLLSQGQYLPVKAESSDSDEENDLLRTASNSMPVSLSTSTSASTSASASASASAPGAFNSSSSSGSGSGSATSSSSAGMNKVQKPKGKRQSSASTISKSSDFSSRLSLNKRSTSLGDSPLGRRDDEDDFIASTREKLKIRRSNAGQIITQNFDNLLPMEAENEVIYPVYEMTTSAQGTPHLNSRPFLHKQSSGLAGAINQKVTFRYKRDVKKINYEQELLHLLKTMGPLVQRGQASLPQIRNLYTMWLNSFIYKGYTSSLMFNCLLNLNTNYLITNCFTDSYKYYSSDGEIALIARGIQLAKARQTCLVKSINYYAEVIKELRGMLSTNHDPDTAGSVSYILSLMSVYDPESSLNSTTCFIDGLFGVLAYNINILAKSGIAPILVPIHLKLMTNVAMSVYLPGYNPTFLYECRQLLTRFGDILLPMIDASRATSSSRDYLIHQFLEIKYRELFSFVNEAIDYYIPHLNANLADMELQQQLLYEMIMKWVRIFPGKFIANKKVQGPMEKMLYLFYKAFKKAFFAVCPQIKFFFLRDFDSPLMMDVFASHDDYDIYNNDIESPTTRRFSDDVYMPYVGELKYMASYLIRLITFFQMRLSILYRFLMIDMSTNHDFKYTEVNQWRRGITDIMATRREFIERAGVREVYITMFSKQYLRKLNYPEMTVGYEIDADELMESTTIDDGVIDIMSLQPSGLLQSDYDIRVQK
ncbi:hypothetical protein LELG_03328 [Lodderomyces elongisporus NRRL YB-4239]|uniref:Zn(2)-C6 fungal-type domain-containing protein n=1 Tax=Lodderomyces elongisporus (strain ATCC 11503 / CBS 2605 / JCM 1781 / NBRC 1676 / NRRL YB-4239) TaxID=379508 RepID=A5E141_LODEL|nr:hypothetical protein LELG_03328 [Lodderomyces elongisporus NRRL YB-4239]